MPETGDLQHDVSTPVLAFLAHAPEGLPLLELLSKLNATRAKPMARRTLARRLQALRIAGRIVVEGAGQATRYRVTTPVPSRDDDIETALPDLSPAGAIALGLVRQPKHLRRPVGYNESMLRDYRPGEDWYLPETTRVDLHEIGRTPDIDRPAGTFARDIFERLLIDLSWASSHLEGNTYSLLDTRKLLEEGTRAEGKDAAEAQMLLNHKKAIELLVDRADDIAFNRYTLFNLHAALSENLLDDARSEGRLRMRPVEISGSTFVPLAIPPRLEELFDLFLTRAAAIPDPFEQSFFAMVHIPYLQPFLDANKRTSRLAANIPLVKSNYCPLSFIDVAESAYIHGTLAVYELNDVALLRDVYIGAYRRSAQRYRVIKDSVVQPDPIRLRYRTELANLVRQVVAEQLAPELLVVRALVPRFDVSDEDRARFCEIAISLLDDLHEGSVARYGVRPSQFHAWRAAVRPDSRGEHSAR